ncbi:MAG TPA: thymidine phosphorylase family protein [Alphaproteobacteria bacterium]|nr:thymidine phosphorylase family protein [Alphaproteobacteria bacterium]
MSEAAPGLLKLRRIQIDAYQESIAFLSRSCRQYRPEEFSALEKVEISAGEQYIVAVLNVVDDPGILADNELGLGERAFRSFGQPEGSYVSIAQATPPRSLEAVRRKIRGHSLSEAELDAIVRDITANRYSKMEIAAFLISSAGFMAPAEVLALTRAMANAGTRLSWSESIVVDKHCIGGIPGNRTSMIVVPIVAAHGLTIPKTSSRAITSPAGTADTMEVLARVDLSVEETREVVEREKGCLVWGGHMGLSPADDILISVERPLSLDPPEQMVASILSKKAAAGSTHLVIDMPIGPTSKLRSLEDAVRLRKLFEHVADAIAIKVDVAFTDGTQPIGRGVGPVLEARDVLKILHNEPDAPADLRDHALTLASRILEFDPSLRGGDGRRRAELLLSSGAALRQMERIIAAQGQSSREYPLGHLIQEIESPMTGRVEAIDCYRIARIARLAGAPIDKGAGIDLLKKVGDCVLKGEPLYRVHALHATNFKFAIEHASAASGYSINQTVS